MNPFAGLIRTEPQRPRPCATVRDGSDPLRPRRGRPPKSDTERRMLTPLQKQILTRLTEHGSNLKAAEELGASAAFIARQMDSIKRKTGIEDRLLLVLWWDRQQRNTEVEATA